MLHYSRLQLTTIIAVPIVSMVLLWAIVIFHRNRKRWRCYDLTIVAILVQSVLRNAAVIVYTVLQMADQNDIRFDYCSVFVWLFNSIHSFQASTLSTLAVIGFFSVKLHRKKDSLKNYLTTAHVVYHLFCLTTLCACVGVAAILAKQTPNDFTATFNDFFPLNLCKFMPYEMDVKYNVFVITLHVFLAIISLLSFVLLCHQLYLARRAGFNYLNKSNSDLSELSLGLTTCNNYYDTYSVSKIDEIGIRNNKQFQGRPWHSDQSNMSTTVSSTNSRRPCLNKQHKDPQEEGDGIGLETVLPVLTVCYLFNHVPVIVLCLFPAVLSPWGVATAALCLGLLQDLLVPLSLGLVDSRFCQWISNVYRCDSRSKLDDKLPQVGLDGKFRPFPMQQSLESGQVVAPEPQRIYQPPTEPKFPITNGSLYTSIDGRLPIIHNYRRHKDRGSKPIESNLINLGVHATYLKQQQEQNVAACVTCESTSTKRAPGNLKINEASLERFGNLFLGRSFQFGCKSLSQSSLRVCDEDASKLRLSKSHDSLDKIVKNREKLGYKPHVFLDVTNSDSDDDEYFTDSMNLEGGKNFDSISSRSSFSITTEANGDFDFYQLHQDVQNNNSNGSNTDFIALHGHQTSDYHLKYNSDDCLGDYTPKILQTFKPHLAQREQPSVQEIRVTRVVELKQKNFKIKRSNSKRSLENFVNFVNDSEFVDLGAMQRSFSYVALDETNNNLPGMPKGRRQSTSWMSGSGNNCVGSVPDFKKIFISEYL